MTLIKALLLTAALALVAIGFMAGGCTAATDTVDGTEMADEGNMDGTSVTGDEASATEDTAGTNMEPAAYTNDKGEIVCPVMGSVIKSADDAVGYEDHDGMRYYFCCDGCPDQFKEDPHKFVTH